VRPGEGLDSRVAHGPAVRSDHRMTLLQKRKCKLPMLRIAGQSPPSRLLLWSSFPSVSMHLFCFLTLLTSLTYVVNAIRSPIAPRPVYVIESLDTKGELLSGGPSADQALALQVHWSVLLKTATTHSKPPSSFVPANSHPDVRFFGNMEPSAGISGTDHYETVYFNFFGEKDCPVAAGCFGFYQEVSYTPNKPLDSAYFAIVKEPTTPAQLDPKSPHCPAFELVAYHGRNPEEFERRLMCFMEEFGPAKELIDEYRQRMVAGVPRGEVPLRHWSP